MKNRFIFDLDGTIVDTQTPFHATAECAVLKEYCKIVVKPEEISARFAGMPTKHVFRTLAPDYKDVDFLWSKKWETIFEMITKEPMECLPGMNRLIFDLWMRGFQISIASASPMRWINECLDKKFYDICDNQKIPLLNLRAMFKDKYFSAELCKNPKPAPDVLYMASKAMKETMGRTYVVGDGRSDVLGGTAANMHVLYLSKDNIEFDGRSTIKRFETSEALVEHIRLNLI